MSAIPKGEHEQRETISIDIFVPDHAPRTESAIFRATRKKLISDNPDAQCWICGCKDSPAAPLELHHFWIEWCDSEGVDWEKAKRIVPGFDWDHFDPAHPETFIDSECNAWLVLCKKHHTGKDHGIHMLPYPMWLYQLTHAAGEVFSPDEESSPAAGVTE